VKQAKGWYAASGLYASVMLPAFLSCTCAVRDQEHWSLRNCPSPDRPRVTLRRCFTIGHIPSVAIWPTSQQESSRVVKRRGRSSVAIADHMTRGIYSSHGSPCMVLSELHNDIGFLTISQVLPAAETTIYSTPLDKSRALDR